MADLLYNRPEDQIMEGVDYFDLIPDPILNLIFNKIFDAKSLCRCLLVSKRFATIVSEVDSISIQMNNNHSNGSNNHPKSKKPSEESAKLSTGSKSFFKNSIFKFICKPINLLQQAISSKKMAKNGGGVDIMKWVGNTLKNFQDIESIKLELPCHGGEIGINKNIPLLKWEAEFGKEMEMCAILGATSIVERREKKGPEIEGENEVQVFSDEELKLRIIWIISCLIASSARHNLVKKMVNQCPKLSNAVVSDAGKQGKLCMNAKQIQDLKDSIEIATVNASKSENPAPELEPEPETSGESTTAMAYAGNLVMKMWYVKELELPNSGKVMKGATLVVIKPEKKGNNDLGTTTIAMALHKPYYLGTQRLDHRINKTIQSDV
ncbi:F-box protein At1g30200-like [Chenopodium quinoa]|uniref:F-box protein At1g30200-like n=1 Tax=Chenopodium quinoa TaxID=63459 RepID=UPI000B78BEA6|nr:F-box protein At1g30200-like [Chenopodium quinoa]